MCAALSSVCKMTNPDPRRLALEAEANMYASKFAPDGLCDPSRYYAYLAAAEKYVAENERLKEEVERLTYSGVHSCHVKCQQVPCVQRREIERLRVALNTCKNDYWFMTNLLERYSSHDLEQAVKDCVDRMKFRKPIFEALVPKKDPEVLPPDLQSYRESPELFARDHFSPKKGPSDE